MTYVMSKRQHQYFFEVLKMNDAEILDEINRVRGLHGEFNRFVLEG